MLCALAVAFAALGTFAPQQIALAQVDESDETTKLPGGFAFGGSFEGAVPVGGFETYVDGGFGFGLFTAYAFDPAEIFGLRFDFSWIRYGSETVQRPLSRTIQRVMVDVTTSNDIYSLFFGPELGFRAGFLRPYATGGIGLSVFTTGSEVESQTEDEPFAESTNFEDVTFAGIAGLGVSANLARIKIGWLRLELSARRVWNGRVRYLREGSIEEAPDGSVSFTPIESVADFWLLQLGLALGGE